MGTDLNFPLPALVDRIPDDQPLVLRHRASRFLAVYGPLSVGVPLALVLAGAVFLMSQDGFEFRHIGWGGLVPSAIIIMGGLAQVGIALGFNLPGGPVLAAGHQGVWIRARKWRGRSVFLPWPAVAHIYTRRWFWDRAVCVQPYDGRAGADAGTWARVDMGVQRALFGSPLTA